MEPSAPTFTDINKYAENPKTHTENNNSWKKANHMLVFRRKNSKNFKNIILIIEI